MLEEHMERLYDALSNQHFGKYPGIVRNNVDDQKRGRIEVEVPTVLKKQRVWAMPCVPYAGKNGAGFYAIPDNESQVWVEFAGGNRNYPIWTGCFWPENALAAADAKPGVKFWKTTSFLIRIDDDKGELSIEKTGGGKITVSATEITIEAPTVNQKSGAKKVALSQASFDVFDGALSVV